MNRRLSFAAALLLGSCGYVGDPMPPALKIPVKIETLAAVQRGDRIIVQFVAPDMTTEGMVLDKLGGIDLRIGPGPNPWRQSTWEESAKRVAVEDDTEPGAVRAETPAAEWEGREVIIGVRT
ncbi:MAG: hypothetical protein GY953_43525, partial [bacterium]|nr:hypothetical protein [bacterium]